MSKSKTRDTDENKIKFIQWFKRTNSKVKTTIRIFEKGGGNYYALYSDPTNSDDTWANFVCKYHLKSEQALGTYEPSAKDKKFQHLRLQVVYIRSYILQKIVGNFIKTSKKVIIYEKDHQTDVWKPKADEEVLSGDLANDNNKIKMAIYLSLTSINTPKKKPTHIAGKDSFDIQLGVCVLDELSRSLSVVQMGDNQHFTNLKSLLALYHVRECFYYCSNPKANPGHFDKFVKTLDQQKFLESSGHDKSKDFFTENTTELKNNIDILGTLINSEITDNRSAYTSFKNKTDEETKLIQIALSGILNKYNLYSDKLNHGVFCFKFIHNTDYMKLDNAALTALHVFPSSHENNKNQSIFGLLNHCKTIMGERKLKKWLRQPLSDYKSIVQRQSLVELFYHNSIVSNEIRNDYLISVPDLEKLLRSIYKRSTTLKDLVSFYNFIDRIDFIANSLKHIKAVPNTKDINIDSDDEDDYDEGDDNDNEMQGNNNNINNSNDIEMKDTEQDDIEKNKDKVGIDKLKEYIDQLQDVFKQFSNFQAMIEQVVDLDKIRLTREYRIKPSFDLELKKMDECLITCDETIDKEKRKMEKKVNNLSTTKKKN